MGLGPGVRAGVGGRARGRGVTLLAGDVDEVLVHAAAHDRVDLARGRGRDRCRSRVRGRGRGRGRVRGRTRGRAAIWVLGLGIV